jgi:hypothetical protein
VHIPDANGAVAGAGIDVVPKVLLVGEI